MVHHSPNVIQSARGSPIPIGPRWMLDEKVEKFSGFLESINHVSISTFAQSPKGARGGRIARMSVPATQKAEPDTARRLA